jgi:hypothetical protein
MWFTLAYAALVVAGTINRELTGVLLVLAFWVLRGRDWQRGLLFTALFAATYAALRLAIGPRPMDMTFEQTLEANLASWRVVLALLKNLAFVPLWVLAVVRLRRAPVALRRLTIMIVPIYTLAFILGAIWQEVRLWLPVLLILLPIALAEKDDREESPAS